MPAARDRAAPARHLPAGHARRCPARKLPFKIGAGVLYEPARHGLRAGGNQRRRVLVAAQPLPPPGHRGARVPRPIPPGLPIPAFMARIEAVVETQSNRLMREAGFAGALPEPPAPTA